MNIDRLVELREQLMNRHSGFPFLKCEKSSRFLHAEEDLIIVEGLYIGPLRSEKWIGLQQRRSFKEGHIDHYVSFDPDSRNYIDMTANQYDPSLPDILIMSEHDPRIATHRNAVNGSQLYLPRKMFALDKENPIRMVQVPVDLLPAYLLPGVIPRPLTQPTELANCMDQIQILSV